MRAGITGIRCCYLALFPFSCQIKEKTNVVLNYFLPRALWVLCVSPNAVCCTRGPQHLNRFYRSGLLPLAFPPPPACDCANDLSLGDRCSHKSHGSLGSSSLPLLPIPHVFGLNEVLPWLDTNGCSPPKTTYCIRPFGTRGECPSPSGPCAVAGCCLLGSVRCRSVPALLVCF